MKFFPYHCSRSVLSAVLATAPLFAAGCFVVEDGPLNTLVLHETVDAGTVPTSETCGGVGATNIVAGTYSVANGDAIDTRNASNDVDPTMCISAPGPEVFVQFEATAAQYWHFHVHTNNPPSADGGAAALGDPVLLLYQVNTATHSCNTTDCTYVSNRCPAGQDEHFGVEIPSTGTWALGIDNATAYGSRYDVAVFRPTCGQNGLEHGEGCDDGNLTPGDTCDEKCRREITITNTGDLEPNDDRFWANHVIPTMNTTFQVNGIHGICDADTFMVRVAPGQTLDVYLRNGTTNAYFTPALIPALYTFNARTATGGTVYNYSAEAGTGYAKISLAVPALGSTTEYFINVSAPSNAALDTNNLYTIEFNLH